MKVTVQHTFIQEQEPIEVPPELEAGASPDATAEQRHAFRDWLTGQMDGDGSRARWDSSMAFDDDNNEVYSS